MKIQNLILNLIAYANDINLFSTTSTELQELINTSETYAKTWQIRFNPTKTKCTHIGKSNLKEPPTFQQDGKTIQLSEGTTILGVNLIQDMKSLTLFYNHLNAKL